MLVDEAARVVLELVGGDAEVAESFVGLRYSASVAEASGSREAGVAGIPLEDLQGARMAARPPTRSSIPEMVRSLSTVEKSLAVSALNALSQHLLWARGYSRDYRVEWRRSLLDAVELDVRGDDLVVVVGNMIPLVERLRERGCRVLTFERNPGLRRGAYPDSLEYRWLAEADVVFVTGMTLVNDTVDAVLAAARRARTRVLIGPTASTYPEPLLRHGFTHVAGVRVADVEKALSTIRMGGGRWDMDPFLQSYVISPR